MQMTLKFSPHPATRAGHGPEQSLVAGRRQVGGRAQWDVEGGELGGLGWVDLSGWVLEERCRLKAVWR